MGGAGPALATGRAPRPHVWSRSFRRGWLAGISAGVVLSAAVVGICLNLHVAGTVTITGTALSVTYTSPGIASSDPVSENTSLGGPSALPINGSRGSAVSVFIPLSDSQPVNCTVWSAEVGYPFGLIHASAASSASPEQPTPLPVGIRGSQDWPGGPAVFFTWLNLTVDLPQSAGAYLIPVSLTVSC